MVVKYQHKKRRGVLQLEESPPKELLEESHKGRNKKRVM